MERQQSALGSAQDGAGAPPSSALSAQDRLLEAVSQVVGRDGYAGLTVERILTASGVSRATFYQYFCNAEDCLWSAYRLHAEQLVAEVSAALAASSGRELAVLDTLVATAVSRPGVARLLMTEGLAAGHAGRVQRDDLIARIARAVDASAGQPSRIDLPGEILIGGAFRFLSVRLADGGALEGVDVELREWAGAFTRRPPQPFWSARLAPAPAASSSPPAQSSAMRPHGDSRERILRATAATIREKGYRTLTVSDIVAAAGVSRRSFYNQFPSKSAAFEAAYEHIFRRAIAACAPAFFGPRAWPERVWQGAQALTGLLSREPLLTYLAAVECYALGPGFLPRVHDTQLAFTLFLEEGYRQRPQAESLSRSCASLTVAAIVEVGFHACRSGASLHIRRLQPLAVYIALTPFIGSDAAAAFVTRKLSAQTSRAEVVV